MFSIFVKYTYTYNIFRAIVSRIFTCIYDFPYDYVKGSSDRIMGNQMWTNVIKNIKKIGHHVFIAAVTTAHFVKASYHDFFDL